MSAISELREKDFNTWNNIEKCIAEVWEQMGTEWMAEAAAAELAAKDEEISNLKAELETQSNAAVSAINSISELLGVDWDYPGQVVRDVAALTERVGMLEARNKWWLENYDITMPCGHKNRYLDVNVKGEIVRDENGDGVCTMCIVEAK
jgi:hypothetical protein